MTRQSTKQRGITLVEVMLTLAISSLLIVTVLSGRNSIRSQAQFSDGMERIKETILGVKSQANTSNNTKGNGTSKIGSGTSRYLTLGKSIRFTAGSSTTQTTTVMCYATTDALCNGRLNVDGNVTQTLPWGIKYTGYEIAGRPGTSANLTLIFTRDDTTGSFTGYYYEGTVANNNLQTTVLSKSASVALIFKSPDGRTAIVDVNPATGTVTRKVL